MTVFERIAIMLSKLNAKLDEDLQQLTLDSVNISERVVGGKVEVIAADGTLSPLPNGSYELSDGFKFVVVDGFITELIEDAPEVDLSEDPDPEEPPVEDEPAPESLETETDARLTEIENRIAGIETSVADIARAVEALAGAAVTMSNQGTAVGTLSSDIQAIKATLSAMEKAPGDTKTPIGNREREDRAVREKGLASAFAKLRANA